MARKVSRRVLEVGDLVLGKYSILKVLSRKGMSNVYLVQDNALNKQWVLKEIVKNTAGVHNIEYDSLLREANIVKQLNHTGIPRITSIHEDEEVVFITMDYVDGKDAQVLLNAEGTISEKTAVSWIKQVANIVGYLHNLQTPIAYRDLKPGNIQVQANGVVRLLDFGISEILTPDNRIIVQPLGTRGFTPPEQLKKGLPYDLRSDIYALGVTFHYLLTGQAPAKNKSGIFSLREVDRSLSVGLEEIVRRCTMLDTADRYQTIEEVLFALQNYGNMDAKYIKGVKTKLHATTAIAVMGALALAGAGVNIKIASSQSEDRYASAVTQAEQSGRFQDYIDAIALNPTTIGPYTGLIESAKTDGDFSADEEKSLLGQVNPNLTALKSLEGYGDLSFDIGKLYWFYYDSTTTGESGQVLSTRWFEDALAKGTSNEDQAAVFYRMGSFQRDISSAVKEASDSGMYKSNWDDLLLSETVVSGEVNELQLKIMISQFIDTYSFRLGADGVTREEVEAQVTALKEYVDGAQTSPGTPTDLLKQLKTVVAGLDTKVTQAYKEVQ